MCGSIVNRTSNSVLSGVSWLCSQNKSGESVFGAVKSETKEPRPTWIFIISREFSTLKASRTEERLAPNRSQSPRSEGSFAPGSSVPILISAASSSTTLSTTLR